MYQFFYSISKLHFISPGDASFSYFIQQQLITTNDDASQHWLTYIKKYIYTKFHQKKSTNKTFDTTKKAQTFWFILTRTINKIWNDAKIFLWIYVHFCVCVPLTISYYCCCSCACLILINTIGQIWIQKRKKKQEKLQQRKNYYYFNETLIHAWMYENHGSSELYTEKKCHTAVIFHDCYSTTYRVKTKSWHRYNFRIIRWPFARHLFEAGGRKYRQKFCGEGNRF